MLWVRAITGHNFLGRHQHFIDPNISKVCRFCKEDEETFYHYLVDCLALRTLRQEIFLTKEHPTDNSWSVRRLKLFMLDPIIFRTLTTKFELSDINIHSPLTLTTSDIDSSLLYILHFKNFCHSSLTPTRTHAIPDMESRRF